MMNLRASRREAASLAAQAMMALARANEGDLTVRSEPGAGATFVLEMPAAKAE